MREILFRGKRTDDNEWYYGDLIHYKSGQTAILYEAFSEHGYEATEICNRMLVVPKTIGQYTGLTDKNGVGVFEGDIVKGKIHTGFGYRIRKGVIVFELDRFCIQIADESDPKNLYGDFEVIGNVHDNPELLNTEDKKC